MLRAQVMKDLTANTKYYYMVGGSLAKTTEHAGSHAGSWVSINYIYIILYIYGLFNMDPYHG